MNPLQYYIYNLRQGTAPAMSDDQLDWLADRYPFFSLPFATTALQEREPGRRSRLLERVALSATDREMLFRLISPDGTKFAHFYPDEAAQTPDTDSAIDTFLSVYGSSNPREEVLLERLIFNPVADYSAVLEREAEREPAPAAAPDSQDALLDAFLHRDDAAHQVSEVAAIEEPESAGTEPPAKEAEVKPSPARVSAESSLSESLAKIYIKQRRFDKAYEIISQLNLNFPEKSIYFADQLRFLKKLMRNQALLDQKKK